ncbi:MAG: hypothetical protein IJI22_02195 [Bacilli bacterium]|nr:hypothetical protein [Bacilli bacterium]
MHLSKKQLIIITSIVLLFAATMTTIAYLTKSSLAANEFEIGRVSNQIEEKFQNNIKEDVKVKNTGNVPSYVRAAIIVSFKDENGVILYEKPVKDVDYELTLSTSSNWLYKDGYYYYKLPVEANASTDILIKKCIELGTHTNKTLDVTIISQTIQANPEEAVEEAWNVNVENHNINLES